MSKVYIPDADVVASGWLDWPEECPPHVPSSLQIPYFRSRHEPRR